MGNIKRGFLRLQKLNCAMKHKNIAVNVTDLKIEQGLEWFVFKIRSRKERKARLKGRSTTVR
jgi:hypothetical protein